MSTNFSSHAHVNHVKTRSLYGLAPPQTPVRANSTKTNTSTVDVPATAQTPLVQAPSAPLLHTFSSIPSLQASAIQSLQVTSSDRDQNSRDSDMDNADNGPSLPQPSQPSKIIDALVNGTPAKHPLPGSSLHPGSSMQMASSIQFDDDLRAIRDMTPLRPVSLVGLQASSSKTRADSPVGSTTASTVASSRKSKPFVQHGGMYNVQNHAHA